MMKTQSTLVLPRRECIDSCAWEKRLMVNQVTIFLKWRFSVGRILTLRGLLLMSRDILGGGGCGGGHY